MRLTTLARKIEQTPTQLISYLKENGIEIKNGLHSKLDDETVKLVKSKFQIEIPEKEAEKLEITEKAEVLDDVQVDEIITETNEPVIKDESVDPVSDDSEENSTEEQLVDEKEDIGLNLQEPKVEIENQNKTGTIDDLENENSDEIELIKAKKVKLEGIKVVGKIELPEKPVKEVKPTDNNKTTKNQDIVEAKPEKEIKRQKRKLVRNQKKITKGRNRKVLSYEEKLEREEREKLRQRRKKAKEDKNRKKQYYIKNIQPNIDKSPKKKKRTNQEMKSPEQVTVHKNPIKRLWAWLNGKYDKY